MSRLDAKTRLVPSVLDRLIDPDTETTAWQRGYGPEQMLAAVKRDLEELLNTHQSNQDLPPEWEQLSDSLLTYGVPDLVSVSVSNASEKERVASLIEGVIARCEPRLRNVRVVFNAADDDVRQFALQHRRSAQRRSRAGCGLRHRRRSHDRPNFHPAARNVI